MNSEEAALMALIVNRIDKEFEDNEQPLHKAFQCNDGPVRIGKEFKSAEQTIDFSTYASLESDDLNKKNAVHLCKSITLISLPLNIACFQKNCYLI